MLQFHHSNRKESSVADLDDYDQTEEGDVGEYNSQNSSNLLQSNYSRTTLLILDYKQFLAARRIQSFWRGHRVRKDVAKRLQAAITIQRWWRGFRVRYNFKSRIEEQLQQVLMAYYNRAATKIQAAFRGWFVRQTVHDVNKLRRMQFCAAEELLSCVAYKLHHLLRTYSIPGVYSLRNSHCLSKVEKLLSSMTFRFHNARAAYISARMASLSKGRREYFVKNAYHTELPYSGPNFNSLCKPACEDVIFSTKDMDQHMYKIIAEYENAQVDPRLQATHKSMAERKFRNRVQNILANKEKTKRDFCGDVIESMRKWQIWDDQKLKINCDVLRKPDNVGCFLADAAKIMQEHDSRTCHCQISIVDTLQCT